MDITVFDNADCIATSSYGPSDITDDMVCAGDYAGGIDSCQVS